MQVTVSMLCTDGTAAASSLALNAVSAALMCSNIPWNGPLAAVQMACSESEEGSIMQASVAELAAASMSGIYVGTADSALLADFQVRYCCWHPQLCPTVKLHERRMFCLLYTQLLRVWHLVLLLLKRLHEYQG